MERSCREVNHSCLTRSWPAPMIDHSPVERFSNMQPDKYEVAVKSMAQHAHRWQAAFVHEQFALLANVYRNV